MDQVALVLRVVLSLAAVLFVMWALTKVARGRVSRTSVALEVVARSTLGKKSSVAILRVEDRRGLVVGVTDQQVTLLGEVELPEPAAATEIRETIDVATNVSRLEPRPGTATAPASVPGGVAEQDVRQAVGGGRLAGSILAPSTWRQATTALREKTVRQ